MLGPFIGLDSNQLAPLLCAEGSWKWLSTVAADVLYDGGPFGQTHPETIDVTIEFTRGAAACPF